MSDFTECESCGEYLPSESFKEAAALDGWGDEPCCDACLYKAQRDELISVLKYYRDECSGAEPGLSLFHRRLGDALNKIETTSQASHESDNTLDQAYQKEA